MVLSCRQQKPPPGDLSRKQDLLKTQEWLSESLKELELAWGCAADSDTPNHDAEPVWRDALSPLFLLVTFGPQFNRPKELSLPSVVATTAFKSHGCRITGSSAGALWQMEARSQVPEQQGDGIVFYIANRHASFQESLGEFSKQHPNATQPK